MKNNVKRQCRTPSRMEETTDYGQTIRANSLLNFSFDKSFVTSCIYGRSRSQVHVSPQPSI